MRKKLSLIFTIFSICVFLFLIVWIGFRSINTRTQNIEIAEQVNIEISESIISAFLAGGGFNSPYLSEQVKAFFLKKPDLKALIVFTELENGKESVEYIYAVDAKYLTLKPTSEGTWKGLPDYHYSKIQEIKLNTEITFPNDFTAEMNTISVVFGREELFLVLKEALIILLSFLIVTAIFIVVVPFIDKAKTDLVVLPVGNAAPDESQPFDSFDKSTASGEQKAPEKIPETVPAVEPVQIEQGSKGLYSPHSDLGWEEYLEERLSAELKRAASFDQDLVLLLISVNGLRKKETLFRTIADKLREYFNFRDLCFEYGKSGYAIILPNVDLDQGIEKVESFRIKVESILNSSALSGNNQLHAGLSARNGRLTSGSRLILEADRALAKAAQENSAVLAFRVDPQKYRKYLAAKM